MKKFIPILALCGLLFAPYSLYANHITGHIEEGYDLCENLPGNQGTMPSGYSSVGTPGQCYELEAPVTIDVAQPGEAPVTIDIVPAPAPGSSEKPDPVQIDVNPQGGGQVSATASSVASDGTVSTASTSTPRVITTLSELQTYLFSPTATREEKISAIESRLKVVLQQMVDLLTAQIEELIAKKKAEEAAKNATSTPETI